jgi:hypothetical protein
MVEKRATAGATDFDKILKSHIKIWTPNKGDNRVRILPATWPKPQHYGWDIYVHYGVGPDNQAYLDLTRMLDKPDPISEMRDRLRREGRASEKEIKELNSTRRVLVYIVDRNNESEGVQAWAMAQTLDKDINAVSLDPDTGEALPIDDPDEGYDVIFRKDGEGIGTKYSGVTISRRPSPLGGRGAYLEYAIKYPLPDQLQFFSYEDIAKEFGGGGVHRERNDDDRTQGRQERDGPRGDDRSPSRSEDADRGRDYGRGDAAPESRRDTGGRGRDREEPQIDYTTVQGMTFDELSDLCKSNPKLSTIDPRESKDDDELRAWVCEDLKLEPPTRRETVQRRSASVEPPEDKLAQMRRERSGGDRPHPDDVPY